MYHFKENSQMRQNYSNYSEKNTDLSVISLYSLLKLNLNQLKMMSDCDIPVSYYRYIPMFEDYLEMRAAGDKKAYIILHLADKYDVSESTVKRVIKALSLRVTV